MTQYGGGDMVALAPALEPDQKLHIVLNHDKSISHVNDTKRRMWLIKGQQPIKKKGPGQAIHVSDFICEPIGCLRLVDAALADHEKLPDNSPLRLQSTEAWKIIYPGKNHNKWWDITQLMKQLALAVQIFERQFPDAVGVWVFDCSSSHKALAPDALNVNKMNVNPAGKQMLMHNTIIPLSNPPPLPGKLDVRGQKQSLVYPDSHCNSELRGKAKGMKVMLQERVSVWDKLCTARGGEHKVVGRCKMCKLSVAKKDALRRIAEAEAAGQDDTLTDADLAAANSDATDSSDDWCCMYCVISLQEDFRKEKPMLQHFLEDCGHKCIFLPKFHCELAPIELLWGYAKYRMCFLLQISISYLLKASNSSMMASLVWQKSWYLGALTWLMPLPYTVSSVNPGNTWMLTGQ